MFLSEDLVSFHLWEDIFETPYLQNNPPYLIAWNSRPVHWQIRSYPKLWRHLFTTPNEI